MELALRSLIIRVGKNQILARWLKVLIMSIELIIHIWLIICKLIVWLIICKLVIHIPLLIPLITSLTTMISTSLRLPDFSNRVDPLLYY